MKHQSTLALGAVVGAVVGAAVGYLFFTERGRRFRARVQPELDALVREAAKLRAAVGELRGGPSARPRSAGPGPLAWPRRSE